MADDVKKTEALPASADMTAAVPKETADTPGSTEGGNAPKKKRVRKKPVGGETKTGRTKAEPQNGHGAEGEKKRRTRRISVKSDAESAKSGEDGTDTTKKKVRPKKANDTPAGKVRSKKTGVTSVGKEHAEKAEDTSAEIVRLKKEEAVSAGKARPKKAAGQTSGKVRPKKSDGAPAGYVHLNHADGASGRRVRKKKSGVKPETVPTETMTSGQNEEKKVSGISSGDKKEQVAAACKKAAAAVVTGIKKAVEKIPERNRKKILGTAGAILGVYLIFTFLFTFLFTPRTTLNGIKVGLKSYASASKMIKPTINDYVLTVHNLDGSQDIVEGSAVHLKYESMKWIKEALKKQNQFAWPALLFKGNDIVIEEDISYDQENFEHILEKLSGFKTTTMIEPQDAHVAMDETGNYVVYPEVIGSTIDVSAAEEAARECLATGDPDLVLEDYHILPKVYSNDERLAKRLDEWNDYMKSAGLTYIFWDTPEVLTREIIDSLISDGGDELYVDEDKVMNLMSQWREKHDSLGRSFTFTTYYGDQVDIVPGGDYGYELNEEAVCEDIMEKLEAHDTGSYEVSYWRKPLYTTNNGLGGTYIEVSITHQHLWMYKDGELIIDTGVVTGMPTEEEDRITHKGCYSVDWHEEHVQLGTMETRGYEQHVDYWIAFNQSEGIHDAQWRLDSEYTTEMYIYDGSHGCVNTPLSAMKVIFENVIDGEAVVVY